jgi:hypothetical protein
MGCDAPLMKLADDQGGVARVFALVHSCRRDVATNPTESMRQDSATNAALLGMCDLRGKAMGEDGVGVWKWRCWIEWAINALCCEAGMETLR